MRSISLNCCSIRQFQAVEEVYFAKFSPNQQPEIQNSQDLVRFKQLSLLNGSEILRFRILMFSKLSEFSEFEIVALGTNSKIPYPQITGICLHNTKLVLETTIFRHQIENCGPKFNLLYFTYELKITPILYGNFPLNCSNLRQNAEIMNFG